MKALFESGKIKVKEYNNSGDKQVNYTYFVTEELFVEMIIQEQQDIIVFKYTKENKGSEDNKKKTFKDNFRGFEEATDYFESLIREEKEEEGGDGGSGGEEPMPPIGLMIELNELSYEFRMQDGRVDVKSKEDIKIENGILHILIEGAKEKEKFFVQKTKKDGVFALYPASDGTPPEGGVKDGKDLKPVNKDGGKPNGKGGEEGGSDDGGDFGGGGEDEPKEGEDEGGEEGGDDDGGDFGGGGEDEPKEGEDEGGDDEKEDDDKDPKPKDDKKFLSMKDAMANFSGFGSWNGMLRFFTNDKEKIIKYYANFSSGSIYTMCTEIGLTPPTINSVIELINS
jgi:hypothetical protein